MQRNTCFKGADIITGRDSKPLKNMVLLVEGKLIKKMVPESELNYDNLDVVDLSDKVIMPGMINCHTHFLQEAIGDPMSLLMKESSTITAFRAKNNLQKILKSGVTYFRDMGGHEYIDIEVKKAFTNELISGPDFLVSGKVITMTGGHCWLIGRECDGIHDARKAAREQIKAGAEVIKIMATGGVMTYGVDPGSPQLTCEEMTVIIEEAHKAGRKCAAHAQGTQGIKNAIEAGIDSIEHGIYLDDYTIEEMVNRGVFLVPTLSPSYFIVKHGKDGGIPTYIIEKSKKTVESHLNSFRKAIKAGVKIATGSDAGTPFNDFDKTAFEIKLMVDAGMTTQDAIFSSTRNAAELLGVHQYYGTLEVGKNADFIVLKDNPYENINTLLNVEGVYKGGSKVYSLE